MAARASTLFDRGQDLNAEIRGLYLGWDAALHRVCHRPRGLRGVDWDFDPGNLFLDHLAADQMYFPLPRSASFLDL